MLRKLVLKLIRVANKNDLKSVNRLGESLHSNFTTTFHIDEELDNNLAIVIVYEENNQILGYLYALNLVDNIDLLSIVVDSRYRFKGIGSALLDYLIKKYTLDKTITLEVAVDNKNAISLYSKFDFKVVNVRKGYYNGNDAYLMKWGN